MRIVIIGGDGIIARAIAADMKAPDVEVVSTTRRQINVLPGQIFLDLSEALPDPSFLPPSDIVLIAAAMAKFSDCRKYPDLARRINVTAPFMIAEQQARRGAHVIFLSTSIVLDGEAQRMRADRPRMPMSNYGLLKAEAEEALLSLGKRVSILRLTKVLAPGTTLIDGWIKALRARSPVSAFADLNISPIDERQATLALRTVIEDRGGGIYQASGADDISYADVAKHIADRLGAPAELISVGSFRDKGIPASEAPAFTSLDTSRLEALSGWRAPDARSVIDSVFALQG